MPIIEAEFMELTEDLDRRGLLGGERALFRVHDGQAALCRHILAGRPLDLRVHAGAVNGALLP